MPEFQPTLLGRIRTDALSTPDRGNAFTKSLFQARYSSRKLQSRPSNACGVSHSIISPSLRNAIRSNRST
ncbi:hypothetical protein CBS115989_5023 [Aspergillus niger]|nr:hypothetical protein CBS115989_5023 [Aspergillus niger]KAI2822925.1 hypothetical protein CBS133816_9210 [Aspergillus niger]KAI2838643.1 hypothetical protein CBS11232_9571 [Aspergillus niger]KAI2843202.1 hypothetical protein CBS11350_5481 [Aspergillus niger]KAI2847871.1 hypothetical protein CBS12448_9224 [Aspergillus niger]